MLPAHSFLNMSSSSGRRASSARVTSSTPATPSVVDTRRMSSVSKGKLGWNVSTRKRAAQWADSVLPLSPRSAMAQEVGHKTSTARRPAISHAALLGAITAPAPVVMSSDRVNSDEPDWMVHRASLSGVALPGTPGLSRFSRSAPAGSRASPFSSREQKLLKLSEERRMNAERVAGWDPTTYRACPSQFYGMKPRTSEPWAVDALAFAPIVLRKRNRLGEYEEPYADESPLDFNNGYTSHVTATGLARNASLGDVDEWDGSPLRHAPHVLRGMKPVTREPWAFDEQVYNEDTTRDTTDDALPGGGDMELLGVDGYATRARTRQVDRPGFYLPNWESWAAALSA